MLNFSLTINHCTFLFVLVVPKLLTQEISSAVFSRQIYLTCKTAATILSCLQKMHLLTNSFSLFRKQLQFLNRRCLNALLLSDNVLYQFVVEVSFLYLSTAYVQQKRYVKFLHLIFAISLCLVIAFFNYPLHLVALTLSI